MNQPGIEGKQFTIVFSKHYLEKGNLLTPPGNYWNMPLRIVSEPTMSWWRKVLKWIGFKRWIAWSYQVEPLDLCSFLSKFPTEQVENPDQFKWHVPTGDQD